MHTPSAPGAQPWPCACHTACSRHLRTPSRLRSARPRCSSSHGSEYWMFLFSHPPPLRISFTSISSSSHCSKCITGVSVPRLLPLFFPVSESTEVGRNLPRLVASATALRIAFFTAIWLTPTGVCTTNVGMPVSWQIGPSSSCAMSIFEGMMFSAWDDCVPGVSPPIAIPIACRTSGGRLVEVWVMSSMRLSSRNCMIVLKDNSNLCSGSELHDWLGRREVNDYFSAANLVHLARKFGVGHTHECMLAGPNAG